MDESISGLILGTWFKIFFLLTPFCTISPFLALTKDLEPASRRKQAVQSAAAMFIVCSLFYLCGNGFFSLFGVTIDSFRVGAGVLLMLSAVMLVIGRKSQPDNGNDNIAVVPIAIPISVGPGTIGALLVLGAETEGLHLKTAVLVSLALAGVGAAVVLLAGTFLEKLLRKQGLEILSKISGLILASLAAQLIFTGARNLLAGA